MRESRAIDPTPSRRIPLKQFPVALSMLLGLTGCRGSSGPAEPLATLTEYAISMTGTLETGRNLVRVRDDGEQVHELRIARLDVGKTLEDARAYFEDGGEGPAPWMTPIAATSMITPGVSTGIVADLDVAGTYLFRCDVFDARFTPHAALGMLTAVEVAPGSAPRDAGAPDLTVPVTDQDPTIHAFAAGERRIAFENRTGVRIDVAILDGGTAEIDALDEWLSEGQPGTSPITFHGGADVPAGATREILVDLAPGTYRLLTTLHHADDDLEDRFTPVTVI